MSQNLCPVCHRMILVQLGMFVNPVAEFRCKYCGMKLDDWLKSVYEPVKYEPIYLLGGYSIGHA